MQLADAITGWTRANSGALSPQTRRDITDIAAAAARTGWSNTDCSDVTALARSEIASEATRRSSLGADPIGQFLEIATDWGSSVSQVAAKTPVAETPVDETPVDETVVSAPPPPPPPAPPPPPPVSIEPASAESEPVDTEPVADGVSADDSGEHQPVTGESPVVEPSHHEATSFLQTLDRTAAPSDPFSGDIPPRIRAETAVDPDVATTPSVGIFTEAAEDHASRTSSIDWITVAYFAVAAICFAIVIYLAFST